MELFKTWIKDDGPRLQGSRDLDSSKLQSPCIMRVPTGGYRLFYTAVGPAEQAAYGTWHYRMVAVDFIASSRCMVQEVSLTALGSLNGS